MRRLTKIDLLWLAVLIPLFLIGCGAFEQRIDPATGKPIPGSAPIETVGGLLGLVIPWAGTVAGAAATVYSQVQRKNWAGAAMSTMSGLEEFFKTQEGALIKDKLIAKLSEKQLAAGEKVKGLVEKALEKL